MESVTETGQITDKQQLALRKVAVASSSNAAAAFSTMLGREIDADVPTTAVLPLHEAMEGLGDAADQVTAAWLPVIGQIEASVLLLFDEESVSTLCQMLGVEEFTEIGRSAIGEVANVIGTTYILGIAEACGMTFEPEPPEVAAGMLGAVVGTVLAMSSIITNYALMVDTELKISDAACSVKFLFIPSDSSVESLIGALGSQ